MKRSSTWGALVWAVMLWSGGTASVWAATVPVSGMSFWLDAADTNSFPGLGGSGQVNTWADKSASGINLTVGGTNAPTLVQNSLNGLPVVNFQAGQGQYLVNNNRSPFGGGIETVFLVLQGTKPSAEQDIFDTGNGMSNYNVYLASTGIHMYRGGGGGDIANGNFTNGQYFVFTALFNGANSATWINNSNEVTGTMSTDPMAGSSMSLGTFAQSGQPENYLYNGNIAEMLVYNSALTSAQIQQSNDYLSQKWLVVVPEPSAVSMVVFLLVPMWVIRRRCQLFLRQA